jgi:hypothetical protein
MRKPASPVIILSIAVMFWLPTITGAESDGMEVTVSEPLEITRLYSDEQGGSHFADEIIPFELMDFAPPAPPISVSSKFNVDGMIVISSPPGWYGDWHPAPRRQLMFCLSGILEVEVTDGEIRRFGPGDVILVEDTTGKGHISRIVGEERAFMVASPLADRE